MPQNVGGIDRVVRAVVGIALLALVVVGPQTWWGLVGLVPLGTAIAGYCPAYTFLGLSTCPASRRQEAR